MFYGLHFLPRSKDRASYGRTLSLVICIIGWIDSTKKALDASPTFPGQQFPCMRNKHGIPIHTSYTQFIYMYVHYKENSHFFSTCLWKITEYRDRLSIANTHVANLPDGYESILDL